MFEFPKATILRFKWNSVLANYYALKSLLLNIVTLKKRKYLTPENTHLNFPMRDAQIPQVELYCQAGFGC